MRSDKLRKVVGHGGFIMRDQDASFLCSDFQHFKVILACKARRIRGAEIHAGLKSDRRRYDLLIEVGIGLIADSHEVMSLARRASSSRW